MRWQVEQIRVDGSRALRAAVSPEHGVVVVLEAGIDIELTRTAARLERLAPQLAGSGGDPSSLIASIMDELPGATMSALVVGEDDVRLWGVGSLLSLGPRPSSSTQGMARTPGCAPRRHGATYALASEGVRVEAEQAEALAFAGDAIEEVAATLAQEWIAEEHVARDAMVVLVQPDASPSTLSMPRVWNVHERGIAGLCAGTWREALERDAAAIQALASALGETLRVEVAASPHAWRGSLVMAPREDPASVLARVLVAREEVARRVASEPGLALVEGLVSLSLDGWGQTITHLFVTRVGDAWASASELRVAAEIERALDPSLGRLVRVGAMER
jgi:hypothetical protein